MSLDRYRSVLDTAPFAVLGTHGPDRRLHLVPCCFAVDGAALVSAVDHKPKRHTRLARLDNIAADPNVSLLVDHRDPVDWSALWWIRVEGTAEVVESGPMHRSAVDALAAKYEQYRNRRPLGAVILIQPRRWAGWSPGVVLDDEPQEEEPGSPEPGGSRLAW